MPAARAPGSISAALRPRPASGSRRWRVTIPSAEGRSAGEGIFAAGGAHETMGSATQTFGLLNRAQGARCVSWSRVAASRPAPSSQAPCVAERVSAARSCVGAKLRQAKRGRRRLPDSTAAPAPFHQAALSPSRASCHQEPRPAPSDPARTAPGAMTPAGATLLLPLNRELAAWAANASLSFDWAAGRDPFSCSDSPGTMKICQENNGISVQKRGSIRKMSLANGPKAAR